MPSPGNLRQVTEKLTSFSSPLSGLVARGAGGSSTWTLTLTLRQAFVPQNHLDKAQQLTERSLKSEIRTLPLTTYWAPPSSYKKAHQSLEGRYTACKMQVREWTRVPPAGTKPGNMNANDLRPSITQWERLYVGHKGPSHHVDTGSWLHHLLNTRMKASHSTGWKLYAGCQ